MERRWLGQAIAVCIAVIVAFAGYAAGPVRASGVTRTVNTCNGGDISGNQLSGSLDELLIASGDGDTIVFSIDCPEATTPIKLGELIIGHGITIDGTGHTVAVDGDHASRVFRIAGGTTVTINNLTITNGATVDGGGILNLGTLTLSNSTVTGNTASGSGGGLRSDGALIVTNSTISNNTSSNGTGRGGAIVVTNGGATLVNVTLSGNTAARGGGIGAAGATAVSITNSTISGNHAAGNGAGIFTGGGAVTLTNTIVASNADTPGGPPDDINGTVADASTNNLIGDAATSGGLTNGASGNIVGVAPLLGPLAIYTGATQTIPLLPGSPAIDAGNDTTCGQPLPPPLIGFGSGNGAGGVDQRGVTRSLGAHCDIGAFESQGFSLALTSGSDQSAATNAAFTSPLVVTVASTQGEPVQNGVVTFAGPVTGAGIQASPLAGTITADGKASVAPFANAISGSYGVIASATGTASAAVSFSLTNVGSTPVTVSPTTLPAATAGVAYNQTVSASGGSGTGYTFAFTITATDSASNTGSQAYTLTMNVVVTLDIISDPALIARDAVAQSVNLTGIGGSGAFCGIVAVSGNHALLADPTVNYASPTSTGSLTYTPIGGQSGATLVTVTVMDGNANTIQHTFTVTVNVPPTLDAIADPATIPQNAPQQTVSLTGVATGGETQTLTVDATSDNTALIPNPSVTYISPNATGSLAYTPVAGQHGTALVTVTVNDGLNTTSRTFAVAVNLLSNQTYTVGTTSDTGGAGTLAECTNAANTTCRLRDALGFATSGTDTIVFNSAGRGVIGLGSALTLGANLTITGPTSGVGVTISGGGSVGVFIVNTGVNATISDLTIANGNAARGGGILNNGTLVVTSGTFASNHAGNDGGGIANNGTLSVTNSTFGGNGATSGGGIANSGALTVTNSTLNGNTATDSGANGGGGVNLHAGTAMLVNTIVAGNNGAGSAPDDISGSLAVTSGVNNMIGNASTSGGLADGSGGNIVGHSALLAPLGDHGGTTQTVALLPGSPALGGGSVGAGIPAIDQRGVARTSHSDIGAFQSQGFNLTLVGGGTQSVPVTTAFSPLAVSVSAIQAGAPFNEPVNGGLVTFTGPGGGPDITTDPATATIIGGQARITPSANGTAGGPYAVTATITASGPPSVAFSLTNTAPTITLSPTALPNGTVGGAYPATTITANGGAVPYIVTVITGALPDGLSLAKDGVLSGAPSAPGAFTFTVQAKDANTFTGTRAYSVTIAAPAGQTYTVGTTSDSSSAATFAACTTATNAICRLRDAVGYAASGTDTVVFNSNGRGIIALGGTLTLGTSVTISGPASGAGVTVSGGGSVRVFAVNSGAMIGISNLTIASGMIANDTGAGIFNNGTLSLASVTISGNTATGSSGNGGGVFNAGALTLTNCTLSGNTATNGGGLFTSGTLTATNSTVSGNSAQTQGGGLFISAGAATLTNTIVAGNLRGASTSDDINGTVSLAGGTNNLIGSGGSGGLADHVNGNSVGHAALLGPLGVYSSVSGTQTFALLPGSPAIGGGTTSGAGIPNSDQRGVARTLHNDIGAFQSRGFVLGITSGNNQSAAPGAAFASALIVGVTSGNVEPVQGGIVTFTGPGAGADIQGDPLTATIAANGQASVTPTANGTSGSYAVLAAAIGTTPASVSFSLTNVAVALDVISNPAIVARNAGRQTVNLTGIAGATPIVVTATSSNQTLLPDPSVTYTSPSAMGSLAYTPVANQSGTAVVTVTVTDAGSHTAVQTFTVRVNAPPTLGAITDLAPIPRNASQQTVNLAGIGDGGAGESQTLTITATSNNPTLLATPSVTYTSPQATGTLIYTPAANQSGSAVVTVAVNDGLNTAVRTFTVVVAAAGQTFTVGTIADHAAGSPAPFAECGSAANTTCALRDALGYATSGTDTIQFKSGLASPITLTNGTLTLTSSVTITGPGAASLTVSGTGAARVFGVNTGVTATISGLTIANGHAGTGNGGGISNSGGALTLTNVAVTGNSATNGGGISSDSGSITLIGVTLRGNSATGGNGGGIANNSGSTATGNGGGIINNSGTLTLASVTISGNGAAAGGGIQNVSGAVTLANTIVAGNTHPANIADNIGGAGAVVGTSHHNLIGTGGSGGLTNGANNNLVGVANPGLDTLKSNGGPTQTVALLATSPAIAAGDHTACAAPVGGVDQRGLPRPAAVCAIGAYEPQVALTAISVASGSTGGGTPITLTGTGFASGATVSFGATAATNVVVVDTTTVTATIPGHAVGTVAVIVTTGGLTKTLPAAYTYGIVNPIALPQPSGPTNGIPNPRPAPQPSGPAIGIPDPLPPSR